MAKNRVVGGENLKRYTRKIKRSRRFGTGIVEAGFYASSTYENGTPVTTVAAAHEFGYGVPERPFMRPALKSASIKAIAMIRAYVKADQMAVKKTLAGLLGNVLKNEIQTAIRDVKTPPNAPGTVARKGSSNPLIDTGFMRQSATWRAI